MATEEVHGKMAEDFQPAPKVKQPPLCPVCKLQMRWNSARARWECPADHFDRYYLS